MTDGIASIITDYILLREAVQRVLTDMYDAGLDTEPSIEDLADWQNELAAALEMEHCK